MWSAVKTEAIILKAEPFKEADKRFSALSADFGKLEFIGRGARKPRAKLTAHLEPGALVELEIIKGARQTTVINAERRVSYRKMHDNYWPRLVGQASLGLVDKTVHEGYADPELFKELKVWLEFLDQFDFDHASRGTFLLGGFLMRLMAALGYEAELSTCLGCRDEIMPLCFRWHDGRGGLVCSTCTHLNPQEWITARGVDDEIVTLLRFARRAQYRDLMRPALSASQIKSFSSCVHDLFLHHVPTYASLPFWEAVVG